MLAHCHVCIVYCDSFYLTGYFLLLSAAASRGASAARGTSPAPCPAPRRWLRAAFLASSYGETCAENTLPDETATSFAAYLSVPSSW